MDKKKTPFHKWLESNEWYWKWRRRKWSKKKKKEQKCIETFTDKMSVGTTHRWSGWPGAFCLDCGALDLMEIAIANNYYNPHSHTWQSLELKKKYTNDICPTPGRFKDLTGY